jgi:hypothetical protein
MVCLVKMLRGVTVLRRVTATHVPTSLAEPQVDPNVAHLQALLTASGVGFDLLNVFQMTASWCHGSPPH